MALPARITMRINEEMAVRLTHQARQRGCTPTEIAYRLVEAGLQMPPPSLGVATKSAVHEVRRRAFEAVSNALKDLHDTMIEELKDSDDDDE